MQSFPIVLPSPPGQASSRVAAHCYFGSVSTACACPKPPPTTATSITTAAAASGTSTAAISLSEGFVVRVEAAAYPGADNVHVTGCGSSR